MNNRRITVVRPSQMFDSFMDEFFNNVNNEGSANTIMTGSMDLDMYETDTDIVIEGKVPGYITENITIKVEDNILTIEGTMEEKREQQENRKYHIKEIRVERFIRSLSLPAKVDAEKAEAEVENGILKVMLPKMEEVKPRTITVKPIKKQ